MDLDPILPLETVSSRVCGYALRLPAWTRMKKMLGDWVSAYPSIVPETKQMPGWCFGCWTRHTINNPEHLAERSECVSWV